MRTLIVIIILLLFFQNSKSQSSVKFSYPDFKNVNINNFIDSLNKVPTLKTDNNALFKKSIACMQIYSYNEAETILLKLKKRHPKNRVITYELANCHKLLGNLSISNKLYKTLLVQESSNIRLKTTIANNYCNMKEYNSALKLYKEIYIKNRKNSFFLKRVASCFMFMEKIDSSLTYYKHALKINPDDYVATVEVSKIHAIKKEYKKGLILTSDFCDRHSDSKTINRLNAFFYFKNKLYLEAIEQYKFCLTNKDSSNICLKNLGISYFGNKQYNKAYESLKLSFSKDTTDCETSLTLGMAADYIGERKEAITYLKYAIEILKPDPIYLSFIYNRLSDVYKKSLMPKQSIALLKKSYKLTNNPITLYKIAAVYDKTLSDYNKALKYYHKFKKSLPKDTVENKPTDEPTYLNAVNQRISDIKDEKFWREKN